MCIIHLLETATPTLIMPRRSQRATQSDDERSTPPTPRSPNHESHGRIEAWFEDHEDNICSSLK